MCIQYLALTFGHEKVISKMGAVIADSWWKVDLCNHFKAVFKQVNFCSIMLQHGYITTYQKWKYSLNSGLLMNMLWKRQNSSIGRKDYGHSFLGIKGYNPHWLSEIEKNNYWTVLCWFIDRFNANLKEKWPCLLEKKCFFITTIH